VAPIVGEQVFCADENGPANTTRSGCGKWVSAYWAFDGIGLEYPYVGFLENFLYGIYRRLGHLPPSSP